MQISSGIVFTSGLSITGGDAPSVTPTVEYLVVAGGGLAGDWSGAGGGGVVYSSSPLSITASTQYTITVGAVGGDSSIFGVTAYTGGRSYFGAGRSGGSGGGGGVDGGGTNAGGSATQISFPALNGVGLGNDGGSGSVPGFAAGGGGGAGQTGFSFSGTIAGKGGNGYQSNITGTLTYYGGGGGGGGGTPAVGGFGTGPGSYGGGAGGSGTSLAGTQGVVIIRYADTYPAATSTTGSPTITVAGGYRVYKWTSSGSITF